MDIIKQYYDQEILLTRHDEGWVWVLSLSVDNCPVIISSSVHFPTSFEAEQTAIKGIKIFYACYAVCDFLSTCKKKRLISRKEHELMTEKISQCSFDF